jgi:DNA-binding Lrp family transcriptional regulator
MIIRMDAIDRTIVSILESNGRMTITQLAQRVSLSTPACHRRLRALEDGGVIRGYRAVVDPGALGAGFEVLVQVTMDREDAKTVAAFERGLVEIAEVRDAERLFGDPDYLLRVATADIESYQRLRDEALATLPGVRRLTSTIVMKRLVVGRPYLVRPAPEQPPAQAAGGGHPLAHGLRHRFR